MDASTFALAFSLASLRFCSVLVSGAPSGLRRYLGPRIAANCLCHAANSSKVCGPLVASPSSWYFFDCLRFRVSVARPPFKSLRFSQQSPSAFCSPTSRRAPCVAGLPVDVRDTETPSDSSASKMSLNFGFMGMPLGPPYIAPAPRIDHTPGVCRRKYSVASFRGARGFLGDFFMNFASNHSPCSWRIQRQHPSWLLVHKLRR